MDLTSQENNYPSNLPVCEKHNFRGHFCLLCYGEEILAFENLKHISSTMASKLETLLLAIEITETSNLFPDSYRAAKEVLEEFKKQS